MSAGQTPRVEQTSEPRAKTNVEQLGLVERLRFDRIGQIEPDRADRRFPGDADPGGGPNGGGIGNKRLHASVRRQLGRRQDEVLLIIREQGAEIGENPAADSELLRQPERNAERHRTNVVFVTAKRIARYDIPRPDPSRRETAQIVAADEETVLQQNLLAAPAAHIARFASEAKHPFGHHRIVITEADLVAYVIDAKAQAGDVVAERGEI